MSPYKPIRLSNARSGLLKLCLFLTSMAACAATVFAAGGEGGAPDGWTTSEPREELRPKFSFDAHGGRDGKGAFVIEADQREGLDGWWTKTVPVKGGTHYHFHAARKIDRVAVPRQSAVVRIVWQDDRGRSVPLDAPTVSGYLKGWKSTAEPEFPIDKQTDAAGWTEVSDTYLAPSKATRAIIELHLQWAPPGGRIEWSEVSFEETSPPAGRKVRLAAAHFRPSGKSAAIKSPRGRAADRRSRATEGGPDRARRNTALLRPRQEPGRHRRTGSRSDDRVLRRVWQSNTISTSCSASTSATVISFTTRPSRWDRTGSSWASIARSACRAGKSRRALPPVMTIRCSTRGLASSG